MEKEKYDILFIIKPDLGEEKHKKAVEKIKSDITKNEGSILYENIMGIRDTGPTFKQYTQGYYVNFHFEATNKVLDELKNTFKVDENYIRHLIVRLDSIIDPNNKERPVRAARKPRESYNKRSNEVDVKKTIIQEAE